MKKKNKVGRPKLKASEKKEPTKVIRVPEAREDDIKHLLSMPSGYYFSIGNEGS